MFDFVNVLTNSKAKDFVCFITMPLFLAVAIAQCVSAPFMFIGLLFSTPVVILISFLFFWYPIKDLNSAIVLSMSGLCFMIVFLFIISPEVIPKHIINSWKYVFIGIGFIYYRMACSLNRNVTTSRLPKSAT